MGVGSVRRGRRASRRAGDQFWVNPASMDPVVETFRGLGIDVALPNYATESRLDVVCRAAEPVIKVEVAEGGVEIIPPQQTDDPPAKPDAFRIPGRSRQDPRRFGDLVGLFLPFLSGIGRVGLLLGRLALAALGESRAETADNEKGRKQGGAAMTQDG